VKTIWYSAILKEDIDFQTETIQKEEEKFTPSYAFSNTGNGWFETHLGCSASDFVLRLRKMRRNNKDVKADIDLLIDDVRTLKALEVKTTLKGISWANGKESTIKQLGASDRDLKSLRRFGESRRVGLIQACNLWDSADSSLKMLDQFTDVWGEHESQAWATAMQSKTDAKKMWRSTLHQSERLTQKEQDTLIKASHILQLEGALSSRRLQERMLDESVLHKSMTTGKLSKLLSMYGEEYDIISGPKKGTFVKMHDDGIIIKNPWSYAADFLESDGFIKISERGEVSLGFISPGKRGKVHCEQLHKMIQGGSLQLNRKISKQHTTQHRLIFSMDNEVSNILKNMLPYLSSKRQQAEYVLEKMETLKHDALHDSAKQVGDVDGR
jgi:flagellar hook-basal body complex protein FliE